MWWQKGREDDLERELRADLELEAAEREEQGLTPEEARRAAGRALGNVTRVKEEVRESWGWARWEAVLQDLRYAGRTLGKSKGFALTAGITLALAIGASTAVFTVVDSVILRPLNYQQSGQLVVAWERIQVLGGGGATGPNPRHADVWTKRATAFSGLALVRQVGGGLALGGGHPQLVGTVMATPNLLDVLQVQPLLGRGFEPDNGVAGKDAVAILTYPLWQSRFQGDSKVIGRTVRLSDIPRQIIGVLPASFHFPNGNALRSFRSKQATSNAPEPGILIPAVIDLNAYGWNGDYGNWVAIARLHPGVSIGQAEAQLNTIQDGILRDMPANERDPRFHALSASVQPMQEVVVGDSETGLWLLLAAVLGLLLLACLNLANAQLGRTLSRQREAAVRSALGAARWRLVWNSLAESLLLASAGAGAGVVLAIAALDLFRIAAPIDLPRLAEVHLNAGVLFFSAGLTVAAVLVSGILPALHLGRIDPQASLQQGTNRSAGQRQSRSLRGWLIGLQVFGCTVLLLVTGLFSKSLLFLLHQDKGFETAQVAVAAVDLARNNYREAPARVAFDDAVLRNLRALPGVQSAGLVSVMPLEGESWIEGLQRVDQPEHESIINLRWVSPGYFETMRETLVAGRFFEERDRNLASAVLSESVAKALWPTGSPIGGQVRTEGRTFTVIGVVGDSRTTSLKTVPPRMAYLHYKDRPPFATFFFVRGRQPADALIADVRQAIWKDAPDITIARTKTLDAQLNDSLARERFQTSVLIIFGMAALLLAMLGIYGVLSYSTATRKQEIGVRMALGATRATIYGLTFREAAKPVGAGLAAGSAASLLAARLIEKLLYGTRAVDLPVLFLVAALFLAAAVTAAFLPARRAASVDPMEVLRAE